MEQQPLRPPLYKYAHRRWAEALAHRGAIHLGSLHEYRKIERYGEKIGDKDEGLKALYENVTYATEHTLSGFSRSVVGSFIYFAGGGLPRDTTIANCDFSLTVRSPNCWVYCTTEALSAGVMRRMEAGYDACVRIDDLEGFCWVIAHELWERNLIHDEVRAIRCVYRERTQPYDKDDGLAPVRLKAPRYAEQREVRFVFPPLKPITEPYLDLVLPDLVGCCTLLEEIPE
jgi:hypothetical protein